MGDGELGSRVGSLAGVGRVIDVFPELDPSLILTSPTPPPLRIFFFVFVFMYVEFTHHLLFLIRG